MGLSIANWLYKKRGVAKDAMNRFSLELHWLFVFGLFVSKGNFVDLKKGGATYINNSWSAFRPIHCIKLIKIHSSLGES